MKNGKVVEVCIGSNMDGVDLNLVEFAGLPELSDQQHDLVWGVTNSIELLEMCPSAQFDWQDEDDIEHEPLYTDRNFSVATSDVAQLKLELRQQILKLIG